MCSDDFIFRFASDVDVVKEKKVHKVEVCDPTNCDRICQRLGFKFGVCRGDDCTCSNFGKYEKYDGNFFT